MSVNPDIVNLPSISQTRFEASRQLPGVRIRFGSFSEGTKYDEAAGTIIGYLNIFQTSCILQLDSPIRISVLVQVDRQVYLDNGPWFRVLTFDARGSFVQEVSDRLDGRLLHTNK